MKRTITAAIVVVVVFVSMAKAAPGDWPRWRGEDGENVSKEVGLLKSWPEGGPKLLWELDLGGGDSQASVSIVGDRLFTMSNTREVGAAMVCFDLTAKKRLWVARTTGNGPANSTPTVSDGLVFGLGRDGGLVCARADNGTVVWKANLQKDLGGGRTPGWNFAESPMVDGDRLIVTPGGNESALAALDKKTGKVIWKTALPRELHDREAQAQYSTVVISNAGGVKQYVTLLYKLGLVGVRASDGKFLWNYPRIFNGTANIPTSVVIGDQVFCSTAYGTGAALLKLDGKSAEEVYFLSADQFQNHHGGFVRIGDHIYGGSGHNAGNPTCIEWKTGKVMWQEKQIGKGSGSVVAADGHLYYQWEDGTVALVEANPREYKLKGKFQMPEQDGPAWAHPVIAGGKLYLRWAGKVFCYEVKG